MISLKGLIEAQKRLVDSQARIAKTVDAFAVVIEFLGHMSEAEQEPIADNPALKPKRGRPPKQLAAGKTHIPPGYASVIPGTFWVPAIIQTIQEGNVKAGDMWRAIQAKHSLSDSKRPAFYQALARALKRKDIAKKKKAYSVTIQGAKLDMAVAEADQAKADRVTEAQKAEPETPSNLPRGFWQTAIVDAIKSGAVQTAGIWRIVSDRFKLSKDKRVAFYSGLASARRERIVLYKDGRYSIPGTATKPPEKIKLKPRKKDTRQRSGGGMVQTGFWEGAVTEAIAGGATQLPKIWTAIQQAHGLLDSKMQPFNSSLAITYENDHSQNL